MIRFSTKRLWRSSFQCLVAAVIFSVVPAAAGAARYSYNGHFSGRFGEHLKSPVDPASERLEMSFTQKAQFSKRWKSAFGFSAWYEGVYASRKDAYPEAVRDLDASDLRFRDVFLEYTASHLSLKVGNQQAVWGEAFGYFYSDIINPKDLRDGLFGDFSDVRLQVPMVNAKILFSKFSLQGIFIPKPFFNMMPTPGNDYSVPLSWFAPAQSVRIYRQTSLPIQSGNEEYGGRATLNVRGFDFSVFYFNYFDRSPFYTVNVTTQMPQTLALDENHSRVHSQGMTLTKEFRGFVFRAEGLTTSNRILPTLRNGILSQVECENVVYVIGMDVPPFSGFNLGVQFSQDLLSGKPDGLLRTRDQSLASMRIQRNLFRDHSLEILAAYSAADRGARYQLNYLIPLNGSFETRIGVDGFTGPATSDFGRLQNATRAYILLKYYLKG